MNVAEMVELVLIPVIAAGFWWFAAALPDHLGLGRLLLSSSALLLFQSLLRDIWLLAKARRRARSGAPRVARCMCIESIVGMSGIVIGVMVFASGIGISLTMQRWSWSLFAAIVLATGFLMKDYVLEVKPWRLRRDKDHVNIIVKWRKGLTPPGAPGQETRPDGSK
jgi:hypothetical protein